MKKSIVSTAIGCLVAGVAFAALDASAAIAPPSADRMQQVPAIDAGIFATAPAAASGAAFAGTRDVTPMMVARRGADDPPGHNAGDDRGRGRGRDATMAPQRQGADDPPGHNAGDDRGRGRGRGTAMTPQRQGADDPPGHNAGDDKGRGRGRGTAMTPQRQGADDPPGHDAGDDKGRGRGRDDPPNHG